MFSPQAALSCTCRSNGRELVLAHAPLVLFSTSSIAIGIATGLSGSMRFLQLYRVDRTRDLHVSSMLFLVCHQHAGMLEQG